MHNFSLLNTFFFSKPWYKQNNQSNRKSQNREFLYIIPLLGDNAKKKRKKQTLLFSRTKVLFDRISEVKLFFCLSLTIESMKQCRECGLV